MKITLIIIMFLLIGAFFLISENNLALKDSISRAEFKNLYLSWLKDIFDNSKTLAGYVVRMSWLPEN